VGWQVPADTWIDRHEPALRTALAALRAALTPAGEGFIREKLAVLATYKGSRAGVPAEWELRRIEYVRLLGHYPADIWQDALDEYTLDSRWFPDLSELNDLMHPKLAERRCRVERIEAMLKREPVCTVWRDKEQMIKETIGGDAFDVYLALATPHADDGTTLILAVPNKQIGLTIREKFGPVLERLLQRKMKFILASWARRAADARQAGRDSRATA
jgi:hypothetical protein